MVVVDDLRPDDRRVRPVRLLHHHADGVGIEHDVVVAEQQEGRALDRGSASLAAAANPTSSGSRRTNAVGSAAAIRAVGSASAALSSTSTDSAG